MTDKTSDKPQEDRARPSAVLTTPANKRATSDASSNTSKASDTGAATRRSQSPSPLVLLTLVVSLAALGFAGGAWLKLRDTQAAQEGLSQQLQTSSSELGQADARLQELSGRVRAQDQRLTTLSSELETASGVIRDLDEALRIMTDRGSELVLLNDVDHLATIAQQQLELGGNVRNAIVAMESAQAQLARANRPAMASLLQTMNGDLDRLRAASTIDVGVFSQQLEELALLLTEAPLIMPDNAAGTMPSPEEQAEREQPAPTVPPAASAADTWWEQALNTTREWGSEAWGSLRRDLGDFIDVRRVDDANALLMSPDQAARFRENLRTRVMTAQLALMMRQIEVWRTETQAIVKAIETRYDETSPLTRRALRLARNMADAPIDTQLPTVNNTLQALNVLREEQDRSFRAEDGGNESATPSAQGAESESDAGAGASSEEAPALGEEAPALGEEASDSTAQTGQETGPEAAADDSQNPAVDDADQAEAGSAGRDQGADASAEAATEQQPAEPSVQERAGD